MSGSTRILRSILLLLAYTASLTLFAEQHPDLNYILSGGKAQIGMHADADHCKHINLSDHEHCILCSTNSGRVSILSMPASIEPTIAIAPLGIGIVTSLPSFTTHLPYSHRGPPPFHTFA
jgi:hypothetical protein